MTTERNRETVLRHKERLLERYDSVTILEAEETVSDDKFPELRRISETGYIGAAYVGVVRSPDQAPALSDSMDPEDVEDSSRVLLILHRGHNRWDVPGGGRESDESFEEAAIREVREETAISCEIEDCFLLEHRVTVAKGHPERLHTLWVYFDGRYVDGSIQIQNSELNGAAWFGVRPRLMQDTVAQRADDWFVD